MFAQHIGQRQYAGNETMWPMFYPYNGDARLVVAVFTFKAWFDGGMSQVTVVFLYQFQNSIVDGIVGEFDAADRIIFQLDFDNDIPVVMFKRIK